MYAYNQNAYSAQAKSIYDSQKQANERMQAQADFMNGKHYDAHTDRNKTEYDKAIKKASSPYKDLKQTAIDINPDDLEVVL